MRCTATAALRRCDATRLAYENELDAERPLVERDLRRHPSRTTLSVLRDSCHTRRPTMLRFRFSRSIAQKVSARVRLWAEPPHARVAHHCALAARSVAGLSAVPPAHHARSHDPRRCAPQQRSSARPVKNARGVNGQRRTRGRTLAHCRVGSGDATHCRRRRWGSAHALLWSAAVPTGGRSLVLAN